VDAPRADASKAIGWGAIVAGVAAFAIGFGIYHWTAGEHTALLFAAPPIALVLAVIAIVVAARRRPRARLPIAMGVLLGAFSVWMLIGEIVFFGTCWNWWDAGSC